MEKTEKILCELYELGVEEDRLTKDKAHKVEFLTTTKYVDEHLKKDDKILEIGAGTGIYSLYYASKGYDVSAIELIQYNLDVFKSRIKEGMKIDARKGNALDLSIYEDNSFDITLLLGPIYHLFTKEDKEKAISEALRVTKKGGIVFIAYITNDSIVLNYGLRKGNLLKIKSDKEKGLANENYKFLDVPEEVFSVMYIDEMKELMRQFDCEHLNTVASNGLSLAMRDYVNELSDEEFEVWFDFHLKNCERRELQGYSSHILHICQKK